MISTTEYIIFGSGVTVLILSRVLLTNPEKWVQWARSFACVMASASLVCGGIGWLQVHPWAIEAIARGALLAVAVGCGAGALWLLRSRLRPRGFTATTRRYATRKPAKQWRVEEL